MGGFVREIRQNSVDSHQVSPGYVLTFLRWSNRDVFNYKTFDLTSAVRQPLVVINDAIQITRSNEKKSLTPTATIVLKGGSINYAAAVHSGDFLFINLLNWETDAKRVAEKAKKSEPINEIADGFKGVYKIQSVVKNIIVNEETAVKTVTYVITAAGFTEFNNTMYYNPAIVAAFREQGTFLWSMAIGEFYQEFLKSTINIQEILKALFKILIGKSLRDQDAKVIRFADTKFIVPIGVGKLLGKKDVNYATDLYNYILGTWSDSTETSFNDKNIGPAMNPDITQDGEPNFFSAKHELQGNKLVSLENWNNKTAWSILQSYINPVLNEMFTTYRVDNNNRVQPTVIIRQKPFTNEHFVPPAPANEFKVTRFFGLPRWKISVNLLKQVSLSKNEAARFNFVQVFTHRYADTRPNDMALQISTKNFVSDNADIERHGLRPYVVTSNFDFPVGSKRIRAREWTQILSDWIIDGHLKDSGTLMFQGIQDPVSVGDNIQLNNAVLHIESISDTMSIAPDGKKKFRTTMTVSYGMDIRSSKDGPVYTDMDHTTVEPLLIEDYENERILPGISDEQDSLAVTIGKTIENLPISPSFTPPELRTTRIKSKESNTGIDFKHSTDHSGQSIGKKND